MIGAILKYMLIFLALYGIVYVVVGVLVLAIGAVLWL